MRDALRKVREALASGEYTLADADGTIAEGVLDPSAPTVMAPGTVMAPHAAERAATTGAAALDLTRAATPAAETLKGNAKTLSGRSPHAHEPAGGPSAAAYADEPRSRWPRVRGRGGGRPRAGGRGGRGAQGPRHAGAHAGRRPTPPRTQVGALKEALVGNQVELARVDLENKDYKAAIGRAERALALDPSSAEARQVLDQAQAHVRGAGGGGPGGARAFDAGDTDARDARARRACSPSTRAIPWPASSPPRSTCISGKQAEDARRTADEARSARRSRSGPRRPEGFAQADRTVRDAAALLQRDEFAVATQKFLESRDGYERARRTAEAAQRAAAAAAAARAAAAATVPTHGAATSPPPVTLPPVNPTGGHRPAPDASAAPPTLAATQEPAIRKVIADYGRAIEGKDIALFKAVKPNLTPDEEKRLQESFKAIKSQQVGITIEAVQVDGAQATVKVSRQDTINGNRVKAVQQVFRLAQSGGAWSIQTIGVQ